MRSVERFLQGLGAAYLHLLSVTCALIPSVGTHKSSTNIVHKEPGCCKAFWLHITCCNFLNPLVVSGNCFSAHCRAGEGRPVSFGRFAPKFISQGGHKMRSQVYRHPIHSPQRMNPNKNFVRFTTWLEVSYCNPVDLEHHQTRCSYSPHHSHGSACVLRAVDRAVDELPCFKGEKVEGKISIRGGSVLGFNI